MRQFRNKPKHALYGVTAGATSFVTSVASGFEGLAVSLHFLLFALPQQY
jgi:vacuolar protein sorting-associated protein 13A/C